MDDELAKVVEQAKQIYSQHIPAVDQYVVEAELESSHVKAEKMAMEKANNEKSKKKVAELINFEKKQWLLNNEVLKSEEEKRITSQRKSLEKEYKSKYEDIKETYVDDAKLQQMHAKALKKAKTDLYFCETQHAEALKKNREELEKNINATFQMVQQTNAENRNSICVKLLEFQSQLRADYSEKIYEVGVIYNRHNASYFDNSYLQVTRKRYAVMDDLTKMHENFKVAVEWKVKPLIPFSDIFEETIHLSFCKLDAKFEEVKAGNNSWNAFKDTATDIFAAGVNVGKTVLGIPGVVIAAPIAGIAGVVGGLINLRRAVYGEIDVSELKSIRYLQELKLVAKKLK